MSLVRNKKSFTIGVIMLLSFILIYVGMMSPKFGNGRNGLEYADDMFNSLSKGSAYLIKDAQKIADDQKGNNLKITVKASSHDEAVKWSKLYTTAGANVTVKESSVTIDGDFGKILSAVVADSDFMYHNDSKALETKYGYDGREATNNWNNSLIKIDGAMKTKAQFQQKFALIKVQQKALEPAYNYYGVEIKQVADYKGTVVFLLGFYLIYTMWYGFALYYLFDGLGIVVGKAKKKAA